MLKIIEFIQLHIVSNIIFYYYSRLRISKYALQKDLNNVDYIANFALLYRTFLSRHEHWHRSYSIDG